MAKLQKYVSDELTHFVGRGIEEDSHSQRAEKQYEILIKILTSGWLTHPPHNPGVSGNLAIEVQGRISENDMYYPQVVCFCDIPVDDLQIHMSKYSRFGLSFLRSFLVQKGANPVFYIANNSMVQAPAALRRDTEGGSYHYVDLDEHNQKAYELYKKIDESPDAEDLNKELEKHIRSVQYGSINIPRSQYFDMILEKFQRRQGRLFLQEEDTAEVSKHANFLHEFFRFLDLHIFSFLKFFDDSKLDDDPDNFYMEREWRIIGNLNFSLGDVRRIIIPESYAARLRKDVPTYEGQLNFARRMTLYNQILRYSDGVFLSGYGFKFGIFFYRGDMLLC